MSDELNKTLQKKYEEYEKIVKTQSTGFVWVLYGK